MKILCIIPIYNEEARLNYLLEEITLFKKKTDLNIDFLMINNGSTDNSENILNLYNLNILNSKKIKVSDMHFY